MGPFALLVDLERHLTKVATEMSRENIPFEESKYLEMGAHPEVPDNEVDSPATQVRYAHYMTGLASIVLRMFFKACSAYLTLRADVALANGGAPVKALIQIAKITKNKDPR